MQHHNFSFFLLGLLVCSAAAQFSGTLGSNPRGGNDFNLNLARSFGNQRTNAGGGVFANGNTLGGPVTTGGFLAANRNGHGAGLEYSKTPGFGSTFSQNAHATILERNNHNLGANAFHSRTNMDNGFKFNKFGGAVTYDHANGHSASLGASRIPQLNMNTVDLAGKANLWRSRDRSSTLDLTGGVSRNFGGPFENKWNKNIGLGLTHRF
ncbi:attacin-A [Zeugodacus cucurbitae]|uniref:attacin-A n=1 Tax=Zeugodacus cucurbitae TaxID=28588 RepID=UPI00059686FF|nr:attacin-A [Zeugodacus cucurbitae]